LLSTSTNVVTTQFTFHALIAAVHYTLRGQAIWDIYEKLFDV